NKSSIEDATFFHNSHPQVNSTPATTQFIPTPVLKQKSRYLLSGNILRFWNNLKHSPNVDMIKI
ncbi:hypothetical protein S245_052517, partial [Arachis hypogaea]